ncbi:MAG: hypothetical protein PQJ58_02855 [Spirochaetales bacterium]|nr:hypothetical protein [Spirochaetales bacterium]
MLPFFLILLSLLSPLWAQESPAVSQQTAESSSDREGLTSPQDQVPSPSEQASRQLSALAAYLGLSVEEVIASEGYPDEMYTVRGPSEGQDSVVFFYSASLSLFWAESHVWQVRAFLDSLGDHRAISRNMTREEVLALLGEADLDRGDFYIYTLPQRGYPVSCALYFDNDRLSDLYVYRSDF